MNKKELFWWDIGSTLQLIGIAALLILGPPWTRDDDPFWLLYFFGMFCIGSVIQYSVLSGFEPKGRQKQNEVEVSSIAMSKDKFLGITLVVMAIALGEYSFYLMFVRPFSLEGDNLSRSIALGLLAGLLSVICGRLGIKKGNLDLQEPER